MAARPRPMNILLVTGFGLLLAACSGASTPGTTSAPTAATGTAGAAGAPTQQASAPAVAAPTSAAVAGASDACKLVTKAEVEAAFGETMTEPVASTEHGDSMCNYAHETGGLDLTISISSRPSSVAAIKSMKALYAGGGADVAGVGDAAFEVAGILEFVKGTTLVTIGTGDGPGIITDAKFQALAAVAAGRV
jgi:hypothetical protein